MPTATPHLDESGGVHPMLVRRGSQVTAYGRIVTDGDDLFFEPHLPVAAIGRAGPLRLTPPGPSSLRLVGAVRDRLPWRREDHDGRLDGSATISGTWHPDRIEVTDQTEIPPPWLDDDPECDRLCVVPSRFTPEEIDRVHTDLRATMSAWDVTAYGTTTGEDGQPSVRVELARVTSDVSAWWSRHPPGLIDLQPWLRPTAAPSGRPGG